MYWNLLLNFENIQFYAKFGSWIYIAEWKHEYILYILSRIALG